MQAKRDDPSIPAWSEDQLDSSLPPANERPYFDGQLDAWVFSRHVDVMAAFHSSCLVPASPNNRQHSASPAEVERLKLRRETIEALSPQQLRAWREHLTLEADSLAAGVPVGAPLDLIERYAQPLCLSLAAMVTGISRVEAESLCERAQQVSAAAAEPYDPKLRDSAKLANTELRRCFHSGPAALRDSGFVALSQTMSCILGNVWFALTQYPQEWIRLHQQPRLTQQAVEELLRYAGLVRILARIATADVDINGTFIRKGQHIILRLVAANRDPHLFSGPSPLDVTRRNAQHFSLGAGAHACVAAGLIRMATVATTLPLVKRFASLKSVRPIDWKGGSVFRSPKSLWVCLDVK
jgi:cytochrome P450